MAAFLKLYLIATGVLALLAMAMPGLVILGFFLLFLPGLILSLAPTAFFWGCVFAVLWWLLAQAMGDGLAAMLAFPATAALLWLAPTPWQAEGRATLARSILADVAPTERFAPTGHIRVESGWPRWDNKNRERLNGVRNHGCDNLCLALLFEPGVESVTVGSAAELSLDQIRDGTVNPSRGDRTYRLVPKSACPANPLEPDLDGRSGLLGESREENEAIEAEWALKLANDVCLVGEPPRDGYDMLIRSGIWRDGPVRDRGRWSLGGTAANADYTEVRTATAVLARKWHVRVHMLARPLHIAGRGDMQNFHFGWGRTTLSSGRRHEMTPDILELLAAHSSMRRTADQSAIAANLRANLAAAQADPATAASDPVWNSIPAWFTAIAADGADAEDRALVIALVGDQRLTRLDNLHKLHPVFAQDSDPIRAAIVERLLGGPEELGRDGFDQSVFLFDLPPGTFATLTPVERTLLADPVRRVRARGLIARLGDQGPVAAPQLADLISHHGAELRTVMASRESDVARSRKLDAHEGVITAAVIALCRLGPDASAALPQLRAAEANGAIRTMGRREWDRMLVRVGAPVTSIRKPSNLSGTEANYHRNLWEYLDRFDPGRSCGRP